MSEVIGPFRVSVPVPGPPPRPEPPAYPRCEHPENRTCRRTQSNGVVIACRQCLTCGSNLGAVPKRELKIDTLPAWDQALADAWRARWEAVSREHQAAIERQRQDWWAWYDAYLLTPAWRLLRVAALERDNWLCQGCRKNRASQVHHLTYERVGREMLFDLVSVCSACHDRIHPRAPEEART